MSIFQPELIWPLVTMALLLGASVFFSLAETSLFNLSRDQLRRFRASASPFRHLAARLMDDPRRLLVTVLFGNMLVNIAFFVMGVVLIQTIERLGPDHARLWEIVVGVLVPLVLILVGEVIPKSVAAALPDRFAPLTSVPVAALGHFVAPIRAVLGFALVLPLGRLAAAGRGKEEHSYITRDELQAIVEVAEREGAVTTQESDMLTDILDLGEMKVREVMKPRVEIVGVDRVTPMALVLAVFRQMRHSKMLVYEQAMDNVVGVVYAKTAFLNPDQPLSDLVRPVYYVPAMKTVESLLKDFRTRKIQFAVVVDEYGGVSGLVTLEDCLEQIVGEIEDRKDQPAAPAVQRISESEYLLAGDLSIRSWADAFDLDLPDEPGRYSTLAGFLATLLGRLPRTGDTVEWRNLAFTVEEVRRHRVTRVRLRLRDEAEVAAGSRGHGGGGAPPEGGR
jgi:CBS domain containing-hemolysin-like protein